MTAMPFKRCTRGGGRATEAGAKRPDKLTSDQSETRAAAICEQFSSKKIDQADYFRSNKNAPVNLTR